MKRKNMMFMAADDGAGGGGTNDSEQFVEGLEQGGQQDGQQTQQTTQTKTEGSDDLRRAMTELAGTVKTLATPKTETKAPTQDEINEYWSVYNPEKSNPDFFKKWLRLNLDVDPAEAKTMLDERRGLFAEMQQGLMRQAVRAAQVLMQQEFEKMRGEIAPVNDYVSQQRAEQTRTRFYESYPALNAKTADGKPQFQKILDATARQLAEGKQQFSSEDEYFKALAESAAETIKNVLPTFDLGAKQQTKTTATTPRLPRTSVGGTGGTAGGGGTPTKKSDDDSDEIQWT